ncbi:DUF262 domain-containing protein [Actinosynnema sp. ALI-1.44]|uniref:DUF262 domain-containing protein n=1 Tax=Actinosynnema sp. ALI-1.44 TaxID=1933779 RepID=UPI001EDA3D11|nr:DUF262 domain-containing protein [Actinosynnema sp. ALI-1.44]
MAMTLDSPLSTTTIDVESLVSMAWRGSIRVPNFQRDFRWNWEDVRRLFDSIVRGYPVGSLLLWVRKAGAQKVRLGGLDIEAAEGDALWVVDGQQRITSLANALHPDGARDQRFALAYDLRAQEFVKIPKVEDPLVIPLPVLFDLQKIIRWFTDHGGVSDFLEQASSITRKLRQFEVPAYQVRQADPGVLQDIFDRMNNYGKRLSRAEIFSALTAEEGEEGQLTIDLVAEHIAADLNFGVIDGNTVLQGVLARRGPDVKRDIRDEFSSPGDEGKDAAYKAGEQAVRRAVEFLQNDAFVPHFSMLAYRYLLAPLARIFAHHPDPDPRNRRLLRRWYWRAAVAGPQQFKAGTGDAARMLCSRVRENDLTGSVQDLLKLVDQPDPVLPDLTSFATNQAATKIVLCSWWSMGPRNPDTWDPYEISDLATCLVDRPTARDAVRYLAPNMSVDKLRRPWAANRVLMPVLEVDADEVRMELTGQIDRGNPAWEAVLDSHALTNETLDLLDKGAYVTALEKRQELLRERLRHFLGTMCEWGFENTPPLSQLMLDDESDYDDS